MTAVEQEALWSLARQDPALRVDESAVRRTGVEWFWGPPLRPSPDVAPTVGIPPPFEAMVAAWAVAGHDDMTVTKALLADESVLHDPLARHAALRLLFALGRASPDPWRYVDLLGAHWDGGVREVGVGLLALLARHPAAQRRLAAATHDVDDRVFLKAFRVLGALRIEAALPDLLHIMHKPSGGQVLARMGRDANPVGLGAAHVMLAILQIVGSDDPVEIRRYEEMLPPSEALSFNRFEGDSAIRRSGVSKIPTVTAAAHLDVPMVAVDGRHALVGLPEAMVAHCRFRQRNVPARTVDLGHYRIAEEPVSNEVYENFLADWTRLGGPDFEHPAQPPGKDHFPSTFGDPRHKPSHPVCGVDWFDAYAFCRFYGIRLPTEDEWEWAARGPANHPPASWHAFEQVYEEPFVHLNQWRRVLNETGPTYPAVTTAPAGGPNVSGFGLRHAIGNVWEYTVTNAYSAVPLGDGLPEARLPPDSYMSLAPYHVVIKGGAWTSVADLLLPSYRGTDLLSDRHREIGFRVAADMG